jgi:uncharacterized protein YjiS (DUF1127 family)
MTANPNASIEILEVEPDWPASSPGTRALARDALVALVWPLRAWAVRARVRSARRANAASLEGRSDHLLRDVGLSRGDLVRAGAPRTVRGWRRDGAQIALRQECGLTM